MSNTASVVKEKGGDFVIEERQIPTPGAHQLVVKNHAIAMNPVDHMMHSMGHLVKDWPVILGSDVSGTVHSIGPSVTAFAPGDRVAGFACMIGTGDNAQGAFQSYSLLHTRATTKLPTSVPFTHGATLPMAVATLATALFERLGLPWGSNFTQQNGTFLVWGASSSIGSVAVQFASLLGYTVYATAHPKHHPYLTTLGARRLFDYASPTCNSDIICAARSTNTPILHAFAAISASGGAVSSSKILSAFASADQPAKLCISLPEAFCWPESEPKPAHVQITMAGAYLAVTQYKELGAWLFNDFVPSKLASGDFVPSPGVEVFEGGLGDVPKALAKLQKGVSGTKLVVKLI